MTSREGGTIVEVLVAVGQTVPVETPIARIGAAGAPERTFEPPLLVETLPVAARKPTPVAARLLAELGIEATQINSRASRITKADVLQHLQSAAAGGTLQNAQVVPLSSMRRAIAEHMTRAYPSIPVG